ncbi:hypothetical protein Poly24_13990 [Rosistilla carotiformis]|uniref:Uncharacterized protein n=1 Tax=Rosistilla carotiformis TaxID=2528017 RepID=A0A518JQ76_9BACT|nr:hypothetical protein Poly24_13990 [Rosistilla carotiformis]
MLAWKDGSSRIQNLPAAREAELLAMCPTKDGSSGLVNSAPMARKQEAMTKQESFGRAVQEGACGATKDTPAKCRKEAIESNNRSEADTKKARNT